MPFTGGTREQYYSGEGRLGHYTPGKRGSIHTRSLGNGDVDSPERAKALVEETGCDGIMIGRAARGNPWLFHQILHYFRTGETEPKPTADEVSDMILRHARLQIACKGEYTGIREMRKHVAWYTAGFPHSARLRERVNQIESLEDLERDVFLLKRTRPKLRTACPKLDETCPFYLKIKLFFPWELFGFLQTFWPMAAPFRYPGVFYPV